MSDPPKLTVVEGASEREIAAERKRADEEFAEARLRHAVRDLAVNLVRIMAGGGKDYEIIDHAVRLLNAFTEHPNRREAYGVMAQELTRPAFEEQERRLEHGWNESTGIRLAENQLIDAALRVAASRLARQRSQESNAETRLQEALRRLADEQEVARKYYSSLAPGEAYRKALAMVTEKKKPR